MGCHKPNNEHLKLFYLRIQMVEVIFEKKSNVLICYMLASALRCRIKNLHSNCHNSNTNDDSYENDSSG